MFLIVDLGGNVTQTSGIDLESHLAYSCNVIKCVNGKFYLWYQKSYEWREIKTVEH